MSKLASFVVTVSALLFSGSLFADFSIGNRLPVDAIPSIEIPELDWSAVYAEDATRSSKDEAPRYAIPHEVRISPATDGIWEQTSRDTMRWSLRVVSRNAISLNLGFEKWELPNSASMTVSATDGSMAIRPFTSEDNNIHSQLWTPAVPGDDLLIEILVSLDEQKEVNQNIVLTSINVGYRGFYEQGVSRSGSCNVDVVCAEGDLWWDEIPCVAVISSGGSTFCTGFMVNNTSQDRTPYFMTANHCGISGGNAASLVTYWHYQNSYCRVPGSGDSGSPGDGSLSLFNTGATHLTSGSGSDYTLVVLNTAPNEAWEISYCGWDASGADATSAIAIHQPSTDEKRISFEYQPTTTTSYLGNPIPGDGTHVRVEDWDLGTTEPGSSGSPLFNQDHQVIGQLHGGYASCSSQTSDWYGKFSISYPAGLVTHLDAAGTGQLTINTLPGTGMSVTPGEGTLHVCTSPCLNPDPAEVIYTITNNSPAGIQYRVETVLNTGFILINGGSSATGFIFAGGSVKVVISVDAFGFGTGVYDEIVRVTDKTNVRSVERQHTLDIGSTNFTTDPATDFIAGGPVGGPFSTTQLYTITSTRPTPFYVVVTASAPWITINGSTSPSTISLNGIGDSAVITVGFGGSATSLPAGIVNGTVTFDNTSGADGDTVRNVTLDVGRYTYVAMDLPLPIIDNTTTTSTINITDAYCIGDVDVILDLTHTYIGDLVVEVTSPTGTVVRFHDRTGGTAEDIHAVYDGEGGTVPDGPGTMADWIGEIVTGTWTMTVADNAGADEGSLDYWSLKIASSGGECPPVAHDVQMVTDLDVPVDITLSGASSTGNPLSYIVTSLPGYGSLSELDGTPVAMLPYTLQSNMVRYSPSIGYIGTDLFTYKVNDGVSSLEATVTVLVGELPFPDECVTATALTNGTWDFTTIGGTTSADLYDDVACTGTYLGDMFSDVWFTYQACADGPLTVSTCDLVDFDTDIVIYEGGCDAMVQIACNGDAANCAGYSSIVSTTVTNGSMYLIRVGGWDAISAGTGQILVDGPTGDCGGTPCPADLDGDGTVAVADLLLVIDQWGVLGGPADITGDGIVDVSDLLELVGTWGPCP